MPIDPGGIALLGTVTATLASWLVESVQAEKESAEDLQATVRRLEARVDQLATEERHDFDRASSLAGKHPASEALSGISSAWRRPSRPIAEEILSRCWGAERATENSLAFASSSLCTLRAACST
jgi:type II secretory pathway pseudopilin PulG